MKHSCILYSGVKKCRARANSRRTNIDSVIPRDTEFILEVFVHIRQCTLRTEYCVMYMSKYSQIIKFATHLVSNYTENHHQSYYFAGISVCHKFLKWLGELRPRLYIINSAVINTV